LAIWDKKVLSGQRSNLLLKPDTASSSLIHPELHLLRHPVPSRLRRLGL
jgi:hypothetical protein